MSPLVISVIASVSAIALVIAVALIYREYAGKQSIEKRLGVITGQTTPTLESSGILKEPMFPEDARNLIDKLLPRLPNLQKLFDQADFKMQPNQFWMFTGGMALVGAVIPAILRWPVFVPLISGAIFATFPLLYVLYLRGRRLKKFGAQLCEALELLARALRAGHSLAAAMQTVASEMPNPIAQEFGRVYEEQNLGLGLEVAMRNLAERVPNLDLKFFVTAVIIQRQTGGDLAEILDKIGYVIRERFKILGMVQALTGEGRISGIVLIVMPFGLLILMMRLNYEYVSLLWTDPRGRMMSAFGCVMMLVGALVIRKIVNIKV